ncbi:aspartate/glutamate racemase family protein [Bordetella petrii]|uniref:maleate cis-trans isomerase family protein n=1 Tax=Bordetella petrii TaxID=94624 RepID=UPI0004BCD00E|nr:aspartate/glutamate racemase family protein [Bordetella petrii]
MPTAIRAGVLIPANNTRVEEELPLWLPGIRLEVVKIPRDKGLLNAAALPAYKEKALVLARQLGTGNIDVVAYGCTAAGFLLGPQGDRELARQLHENTGKPVATIASSMTSVLAENGIRKVAVVTPYSDVVNAQLKSFISSAGIDIPAFDSLYAKDVDELGKIGAEAVARIARQTMNDDCDAMFIACAQLPTFGVLHELQAEFGRPVYSSIQAMASQIQSITS